MNIVWTSAKVNSLISAFGGIPRMAKALNHPQVTTIRSWREAKRIPHWRYGEIEAAAKAHKVPLPKWFSNGDAS